MIVVTGAVGFIGSCLIERLNSEGFNEVVAVDLFDNEEKNQNLIGKKIRERVNRNTFIEWLDANGNQVEFIFHLGARTDTAEFDIDLLNKLNTQFTKDVWQKSIDFQIPLVYASSAATYGDGAFGYRDAHDQPYQLEPLNPYGVSKNEFDKWALKEGKQPLFWAGLKFFNVYGPNEYHKGRMASVVFHAFNQIKKTSAMRLFRSHNPNFKNGEQMRDFVYVKDVVEVCCFLMHHRKNSGIYNLGSGTARTFLDLTKSVFKTLGIKEDIDFIDTPEDIREKYQYFTEADMSKLKSIGYKRPFTSLEDGINDYVGNYLIENLKY